ncbi:Ig-like domain-containing protein [Kangiella sp.]|uniref:Ig-like domain-containing protein n=1 Tax=Kangiella sp. TaxID=1920245 RepID=UPI0019C8A9D7|nr:Ig-like domain-containing protein [Kangiella sp.]MBD3653414.1 cadherin-like domain-containing protein [Kangiella sp.]
MNYLLKGALASAGFFAFLFCAGSYAKDNVVEGTITINIEDDFANKRSELSYRLVNSQGKATEVVFDKVPHWLASNQKVRIHGQLDKGKLKASSDSVSLLLDESTTSSINATTESNQALGTHQLLVAEVNFAINPIVRFTSAQLHDALFNTAHNYFLESSYQQFGLTGQALEPITVDVDVSSCDTYAISNAADNIIRQRGYEPANYDHVMYVIPTHPNCTWSGKANVQGSLSWIKRFESDVIHHELGHNLGLYHAHSKDCGTQVTADSGCAVGDYGDYISGMGNARETNHFNAFQKEQLGWMTNKVETLTQNGQVVLSPLESNDSDTKVAKIFKQTKTSGDNEWYYIEYRQAIGFDAHLADNYPQFLTGVRLREGTDNAPNDSYLLDTTPETLSWTDISLQPGQTFHDSANDVSISLMASDAGSAVVEVNYGKAPAVCQNQAPIIEPLSSSSIATSAGSNLELFYKVTNQDSSECSSSNFNLSSSMDSYISGDFNYSSVTLAPGASQEVSLSLTVDSNAPAGEYVISSEVSHGQTAQSDQHAAFVTVEEQTVIRNTAPIATNDTVLLPSKTSVTFSPLNNDYDPDGDLLTIIGVEQGSKGEVILNADNSMTYIPEKPFKDSDSFSYTISDGQLTATATVQIGLESSTNDGDNSDNTTGGGKGGGNGGGKNK